MIDMKLTPAITGTRVLGTVSTMPGLPAASWLTCERPSSYERSVQAPTHLQFAGVVPTAAVPALGNAVAGSAVIGTDAARKRGRPPRGIPR